MLLFKRAANLEIAGLRAEIFGLAFLLAAALWQAQVTDWFDKESVEWNHYIQEDVNLAILGSIYDGASATLSADAAGRSSRANNIRERTSRAISKAISERDQRERLRKGQAKVFSIIRLLLAVLGAGLIVTGKYLSFLHKTRAAFKA